MSDRPKTPGIAYSIASLALLLAIGIFALVQQTPPPPTVAEFAPQAQENIKDAPAEQSSPFGDGKGDGECQPGQACDGGGGGSAPAPKVDVPRVRRCIGDPPRQIEDPQSPPCVPYWVGENGGATTKGVTRDEVRVAVADVVGDQEDADAYAAFFNKRFEFYGRKLRPLVYKPSAQTIPEMIAEAQRVDDMKVFGDLAYMGGAGTDLGGRETAFYDELARRGVISIQSLYNGPPNADQAHLARFAPYQWTYLPSIDQIEDNVGRFICATLAGKPPIYAKTPTRTETPRKFGVVYTTYTDGSPQVDTVPLEMALKRCGVTLAAKAALSDQNGDTANVVLQMKAAGVTSVIPLVHTASVTIGLMPSATSQAYFPEWIIQNFIHHDDDGAATYYPSEHATSVFGLRSMNKSLPIAELPWVWARKEIQPGWSPPATFIWNFLYWDMLAIASGMQMAGPQLTPNTFQAGLFRSKFPNPGCGTDPYFQGCVGFSASNRSMINDFATIWVDPQARSYEFESGKGAFCYAHRGKRNGASGWKSSDPGVFQQPCR